MSSGHTKPYYCIAGLLSGVFLCFMGGIAMIMWWQERNSCYNDRPPLRSFVMTMDTIQQEQFIGVFQEFADKNDFKFDIAYYNPNHKEFLVDLICQVTEVIGSNTSIDLNRYYVTFHNNDCIHPIVAADIDDLVRDLKSSISKIPKVVITEEK